MQTKIPNKIIKIFISCYQSVRAIKQGRPVSNEKYMFINSYKKPNIDYSSYMTPKLVRKIHYINLVMK